MQRNNIPPRQNWQQQAETSGLTFHTFENGAPYWDESACYEFTAAEIDTLEAAGNELHEMYLAAAQNIIEEGRYAELGIPEIAIEAIEWAWENDPPSLYGRLDLSWDGNGRPKLLGYDADTPTALLEAAVVQWDWLKQVYPDANQFNSIENSLIATWRDLSPTLSKPIYFAGVDTPEDQLTLRYLRNTAELAGLPTLQMYMEEIGWDDERQAFVDPNDDQMFSVFKLYPWEIMLTEEFGIHTLDTYPEMRWIEPIWKVVLSNKGILPILRQLYPNHELLLPASFDTTPPVPPAGNGGWQEIKANGISPTTPALSAPSRNLASFTTSNGQVRYPILGLWMIDEECCGMGIRESSTPVIDNLSSFVPHYFR